MRIWLKTKQQYENKHGPAYHSYDTTGASPFNRVTEINRNDANILQDWSRFAEKSITINGVSIDEILKNEGKSQDGNGCYFKNEEELKVFFKTHLLSSMPEELREKAAGELMFVLHQGGIQRPVTTAAAEAFSDINIKAKKGQEDINQKDMCARPGEQKDIDNITAPATDSECEERPRPIWQVSKLHFVTSKTGFTLQEEVTQKALIVTNAATTSKIYPDNPNGKQPYVYQAVMTLNVDLTGEKVAIAVINSGINYGSQRAQEILDSRGWWNKLVDAAKKLFGMEGSKIEDLSQTQPNEEDNPTHEASQKLG